MLVPGWKETSIVVTICPKKRVVREEYTSTREWSSWEIYVKFVQGINKIAAHAHVKLVCVRDIGNDLGILLHNQEYNITLGNLTSITHRKHIFTQENMLQCRNTQRLWED